MKPIRLEIEGVNSFDQTQTLDFEAVGRSDLFCICGKTGAGKTTIFDSLMLALYGKSGKGNLADVVNLSRMTARVKLDFSECGDVYTVERTIKCKLEKTDGGKSDKRVAATDCMLYKNGAPVAKGADECNALISGMIGLDESEFKNVYLLEQGEYADFLKKQPAKQTEAVGKIFSLMRFADVYRLAVERARESETEQHAVDERISDLGDVTPERLRDEKTELTKLRAHTTALGKDAAQKRADIDALSKTRDVYISVREKQDAVRKLMIQADDCKKALYDAECALKELESTVDRSLPQRLAALRERSTELAALNAKDKACAAATEDGARKLAEYGKKQAELTAARARQAKLADKRASDEKAFCETLDAFKSRAGAMSQRSVALDGTLAALDSAPDAVALATASSALAAERKAFDEQTLSRRKKADELDGMREKCKTQLSVIEKFTAEKAALDIGKTEAEQIENVAAKALAQAQLGSHAAAVRAELHAGDVCPVCGGKYDGPENCGDTDVAARKAEHAAAAENLKHAVERLAVCEKHLEKAKNDYGHMTELVRSAERELDKLDGAIKELRVDGAAYAELSDILQNARTAYGTWQNSVSESAKLEPELAALGAAELALKNAADDAQRNADRLKAELGENLGKTDDLMADVKQQTAELETALARDDEKRKALTVAVESARAAVDAVARSLETAKADCPVDMPEFDEAAYNDKKETLDRLTASVHENETVIAAKTAELAALEEKCALLKNLQADRARLSKRIDIFKNIAELTKGKAMLNYVAAEYIADFTAEASKILNELSHGKYAMSYDKLNGFVVSDYLNDGKSRKTDTLSGGELFLASLSVAIAIARMQSGGNNAFFFLDEGFGTLDEELIDTVYGALESLSRDCLVGVISHSTALIEKMPACVEVVEATDTSGSIIKY